MANIYPIQANFSRGEASPRLYARVDTDFYKAMLKTCSNWTVMKQGGLRRRPAFMMVKETKDSTKKARLIPFIFGTPSNGIPQAYVLEFGDLYFRVYVNGGLVTTGATAGTPTAITKANPAVVTINAHGYTNGMKVYATGIGGMTELNNREFLVAGVTANTFQLSGINSTGYTTFTSGGVIKQIVEITTTYLEADLPKLDYAQNADKLTVCHLSYQPVDYTRTSDTAWTQAATTFKDGPYFDEPVQATDTVTLSANNAIHPAMTSNVLPSGTVSSSALDVGTAYMLFSQLVGQTVRFNPGSGGYIQYTPPSSTVVNSYWLAADANRTDFAPTGWVVQGWTGAAYVDLDFQKGQSSWAGGEFRYFEFINSTAYVHYRIVWTGNTSITYDLVALSQVAFGYNGDYCPTITATFSATTYINDGAGFDSNDIGRNIRLRGTDGKWRYMLITGVSSTLIVTGRIYGHAFNTLSKITRWRLGSFRGGSWPSKVGYYQSRRAFARSIKEPYTVWLSQTFGFTSFGVSSPVLASDAITVAMLTGRVNGVCWLADGSSSLAVGTTSNVRLIGKANQNLGFGSDNFDHDTKSFVGSKEVKPVQVQSVLLYADFYGRTIREFIYNFDTDAYVAPDLTILSDHLLSSSIVDMAYQQQPDSIVWIVTGGGSLVAMTYERDQKIVGITNCPVAPGDVGTTAVVESVAVVPSTARDDVYITVKRTIGGVTKRYVEKMAPEFEYMNLVDAAVGIDSCLQYAGAAVNVVTGLWHLIGQTVNVLADGVVFRAIVVSATGTVTLPGGVTAAKWTIGLPYSSVGVTLELAQIGQDGVHLGRRKLMGELYVSCMDTLGLKMKGVGTRAASFDVFKRDNVIDPPAGAMTLREGIFKTQFDQSWKDGGQFQFSVDDPLPCTIRGFVIGATGEP